MPELPDVEMYKKEADKALGKKIVDAEVKDKDFIDVRKQELARLFFEKKLKKTTRRGKYLFLVMENNKVIVMHFGMTGSLKYLSAKEDPPEYVKCILYFNGKHQLCFISKRKLGKLEITADLDEYIHEMDLGPDALEIGEKDFAEAIGKSSSMAKSFLMDQSTVSGIGNIYSDEILFQAGINPQKKCNSLTESQAREIYKQMIRVLKKAIEKNADPSSLPSSYLLPNREKDGECPGCKGRIKKIKISGRSGYYCPSCQNDH